MKQSIFKTTRTAEGIGGKFVAEIIATMNFGRKKLTGTKEVPTHRIEIIINGTCWISKTDITSESGMLKCSKEYIEAAEQEIIYRATNPSSKETFISKMQRLFS